VVGGPGPGEPSLPSQASRRVPLGPDLMWRGEQEVSGEEQDSFFPQQKGSRAAVSCLLEPSLSACVNLRAPERTGMDTLLAPCKSLSSGLSSPGHRERGGIVLHGTSTLMAGPFC